MPQQPTLERQERFADLLSSSSAMFAYGAYPRRVSKCSSTMTIFVQRFMWSWFQNGQPRRPHNCSLFTSYMVPKSSGLCEGWRYRAWNRANYWLSREART